MFFCPIMYIYLKAMYWFKKTTYEYITAVRRMGHTFRLMGQKMA